MPEDGDRSTTTVKHVQRWRKWRTFSFLHLVVMASSLLALSSGSLLLSEGVKSLSLFAQAGVLQLFEIFFLLVLGLKKKTPTHLVLKIDRRRGCSSFFFLPNGTVCSSSWRHSPSHAPRIVGLLLIYTRNPRQTGRKRKRSSKRTAVYRPRTRWSRFWFWDRIFS